MRVHVEHRQQERLFGADKVEVVVSVHFTELEETVINTYGLKSLVVMDRRPTVYRDAAGQRREIDNNIYLFHFLTHAHVEPVVSAAHAQAFEHELLAALQQLKHYLTLSTTPPQTKVYEL
jgi:hypothetical protein